jgi:PmbA protein
MRSAAELARAVQAAFDLARAQPDISEVEVFAAANGSLLTRLNYTSHIPCNGVEEPKSVDSYGLGIQAVFEAADGRRLGFGSEPRRVARPWSIPSSSRSRTRRRRRGRWRTITIPT